MDSMSELATASATGDAIEEELQGGIEVLQANQAELENSIYHLVRSNVELAQFLDESPRDTDLEQALEENKEVLVRKRKRFKLLKKAIAELTANHPHLNESPGLAHNSTTIHSFTSSDDSSGISISTAGISRDGTRVGGNISSSNINTNSSSGSSVAGTGDADISRITLALSAGESGYNGGGSVGEGDNGVVL